MHNDDSYFIKICLKNEGWAIFMDFESFVKNRYFIEKK